MYSLGCARSALPNKYYKTTPPNSRRLLFDYFAGVPERHPQRPEYLTEYFSEYDLCTFRLVEYCSEDSHGCGAWQI